MKLLIFDFEVFMHDVLLGVNIIDGDSVTTFQTWDVKEIKRFYMNNRESIWIGHNNGGYDNIILQSVMNDDNLYKISKSIVRDNKRHWLNMPLRWYDIMSQHFVGLKQLECAFGKKISTSNVDFDTPRKLTEEEKRLTEEYNRDDLDQTMDNFNSIQNDFMLRLEIMSEFNLGWNVLNMTGTQIAETVLHAEKIHGIENQLVKPVMYDSLQIKNQAVIDYYLNEDFRTNKKLKVELCGVEHIIGAGGIHGADNKSHTDWAFYFDVSGYYNLIMINFDLLPRSIPDEYKNLYKYMYEQQLILKGINPTKRWVYKTILLSVFGAMINKWCKFYDPQHGLLVTITGQLYLVDLLEKLDGKVKLIQSNTDGIIAKPLPGVEKQEIVDIINEWQDRTGFTLKLELITDIHQRDVNCYIYREEDNSIHVLGEAVKHYEVWKNPFTSLAYRAKEPPIFAHCIVEYFMNDKMPEETIFENMEKLRMFQYIAKKGSYTWMELQEEFPDGTQKIEVSKNLHRVFASSDDTQRMLYKVKPTARAPRAKVSNLPDNIFIYDEDIRDKETVLELMTHINYEYYIDRAYERIKSFITFDTIKTINDKLFEEGNETNE